MPAATILLSSPLPAALFVAGGGLYGGFLAGAAVALVAMCFGQWCAWRLIRGKSPVPELPTLAEVKRAITGKKDEPRRDPTLAERLPRSIKP